MYNALGNGHYISEGLVGSKCTHTCTASFVWVAHSHVHFPSSEVCVWMESACANAQSSTHMNGGCLSGVCLCSLAKLHSCKHLPLVLMELHAHVLSHFSHGLVLNRSRPRSGPQHAGKRTPDLDNKIACLF